MVKAPTVFTVYCHGLQQQFGDWISGEQDPRLLKYPRQVDGDLNSEDNEKN